MSAEWSLARVEAARLVRNPLLWLSFVATGLWLNGARGESIGSGSGGGDGAYYLLVGYSLVLPGFAVMTLAALSALRDRRTGADTVLGVTPVDAARRSLGFGATAVLAALGGVAVMAVEWLVLRPGPVVGRTDGTVPNGQPMPRPNIAQLLQGPMWICFVIALVVALVRWVPTWVVLVPLAFFTMVQGLFFGLWSGEPTNAVSWLWPLSAGTVHGEWLGCGTDDARCDLPLAGFDRTTPWWHLGYVVALVALLVSIAVLRDRRDRRAWFALALALAATVAFAVIQVAVHEPYRATVS